MTTAPELPSLFRADSLAEQAYRAIREGIATGLFSAGERVTERGLAARLNVSATPVREALRRLEQEGLIERVSARQLRVVDHSSGTLRELLLAGAVLRALEARFATHKITEAALDRMAAIVEAQSSEQGIDIPERLRIAREFDVEIERAAGNPTLRRAAGAICGILAPAPGGGPAPDPGPPRHPGGVPQARSGPRGAGLPPPRHRRSRASPRRPRLAQPAMACSDDAT